MTKDERKKLLEVLKREFPNNYIDEGILNQDAIYFDCDLDLKDLTKIVGIWKSITKEGDQ